MGVFDLIYCASGNRRFAEIAIGAGFRYGAQMPGTVYYPPYFVDQDWKKPNREAYMKALEKHRPYMASVMDWERQEQLNEVISWAEEAAPFVTVPMIIPKVHHAISQLPRVIGGRPVRLGYSVPTRFGGTDLFLSEFSGWDVHLLGGSPHRQMELFRYLNVKSCDGNYSQKMAMYNQFWSDGHAPNAKNRYWPRLIEADGTLWEKDAMYEAFRRSCENIMSAWRKL